VRFSRHAKNHARELRAGIEEAEAVVASATRIDCDADGKFRYIGCIRGTRVRVVVALDEPDLIVTIHKRRR